MTSNMIFTNGSPFRIKRPLITTSGFVSDVDSTIKSHLDELNALLGKRIFKFERQPGLASAASKGEKNGGAQTSADSGVVAADPLFLSQTPGESGVVTPDPLFFSQTPGEGGIVTPDPATLLSKELTPKHTPDIEYKGRHISWESDSLLFAFSEACEKADNLSLSDYIDMTADLSALKYAFQSSLSANWFNLDYNSKTVLDGYPAIADYLVALAHLLMSVEDINGLKNFVFSNRLGVKNVADYATVSAARTIIEREQLRVPSYNSNASQIVRDIRNAGLSLSSASFQTTLQSIIDDYIFNAKESKL
ncbi:MAG TPA: hypothetical protein VJ728_12835, partial [Candidatus Binataceae bacterium]|nr:hypothetical protein [Candidatus Binataceae bacterium]